MFFRKKVQVLRWTSKRDLEFEGRVLLRVISAAPYDNLCFKRPRNDPSSFSYVPFALRIKGKIIEEEGVNFATKEAFALIPELDLEEEGILLRPGDKICLWLDTKKRCFKFEKI